MYAIKNGKFYLVKDGELETRTNKKGREVYVSGAKTTMDIKKATLFESITEASRYHSLVSIDGRQGQIVRVKNV